MSFERKILLELIERLQADNSIRVDLSDLVKMIEMENLTDSFVEE